MAEFSERNIPPLGVSFHRLYRRYRFSIGGVSIGKNSATTAPDPPGLVLPLARPRPPRPLACMDLPLDCRLKLLLSCLKASRVVLDSGALASPDGVTGGFR